MTSRLRMAVLCASVIVATGCGEEKLFEVNVIEPLPGDCGAHPDFVAYTVIVWQGDNDFIGCIDQLCTTAGQSARSCLSGIETPALEPGRATRIKAMVFAPPPNNQQPVWCGEGTNPEIDFDTDKIDIKLECSDSCGNPSCQPTTCATERNALCN